MALFPRCALAAVFACCGFAQEFEVASIKASDRTAGSWMRLLPGGRLSASSWIKQLIQLAYGLEDYQVSGGPGWLTTQWYDMEAKAAKPDATREEMMAMLRTLLADRFQLQLRRDEREFPIFDLVVDKGGARLRPLPEGEKSQCARDNSAICGIRTPAQLAEWLRWAAGRPVLDRTGINGRFDILIDFDTYSVRGMTPPPEYDKPSMTAALREQLGLRLEPAKTMLPVLIVEKVERPSGN